MQLLREILFQPPGVTFHQGRQIVIASAYNETKPGMKVTASALKGARCRSYVVATRDSIALGGIDYCNAFCRICPCNP